MESFMAACSYNILKTKNNIIILNDDKLTTLPYIHHSKVLDKRYLLMYIYAGDN